MMNLSSGGSLLLRVCLIPSDVCCTMESQACSGLGSLGYDRGEIVAVISAELNCLVYCSVYNRFISAGLWCYLGHTGGIC